MTTINPCVSKLFVHPMKSLDRVAVEQATFLQSGALKCDREFAILDQAGNFVNGKRNERIHALRSQFDLERQIVALAIQGTDRWVEFHLQEQRQALETWLGEYFGFSVQIAQNREIGFPDDTVSPGPTIISTATLEAIASWYPGLDVEDMRLRFRSNIEVSGVPAFWEDQLFTTAEQTVEFQIGEVTLMGVNPCQRCVVVTRNPQTGEPYPNFQKTFVAKRRETFPIWAERSRFNHFYRLAINTRLPASEAGKTIAIGDSVNVLPLHPEFNINILG
ncbi:MAG: MOSC N-terminal beta barrel domain-containing protein [Oscillatoriales cyanobacterium C42_A2020_001]|nr:MOSC N-terminal beta barrel domain-containing protein [Leptolyngbyaceae cyanobacterium C42_A2020_001]